MIKARYPFPGMNPYLEHPILWEPVHTRLIIAIANQLQPLLDPRYVASVEERVYVEEPQHRKPDVWIEKTRAMAPAAKLPRMQRDKALIVEVEGLAIHQRRVEILDSYSEMKLVAVIELVSPSNKTSGPGRLSYRKKQKEILSRECHLIEIDLLRHGLHVLSVAQKHVKEKGAYDYLVCVNRWPNRQRFELYPRTLRQRLPRVQIPLLAPDNDVTLDLQSAVEQVYHDGRFGTRLKYEEPCIPALSAEDQKWVLARIRTSASDKKRRGSHSKKGTE